jgi:N-acetylglucosamine-6-phosphate deacetylase
MAARHLTSAGLCDLQVNGFAGVDFNDPATTPADVRRAAAAMQATGVTSFLPTLISSSLDAFAACARTIAASDAPGIAGLHMEGPYIAPGDGPRGAHDPAAMVPASLDDFNRRQDAAGGTIRLVTLAPEVRGALDLIPQLVAMNIRVAIGHTEAGGEILREAAARGATLSTHLGNGCPAVLPRHPNLLWEQLALDSLQASFIADGHHLADSTLKAMLRAKTTARSLLVTDATAAAGCPPGEYTIGNRRVRLGAAGRVTLADGERLAGSALTLDVAVGNLVRGTGVPIDDALAMASTQPAAYLGTAPRGTIDLEWDAASSRLAVLQVRV